MADGPGCIDRRERLRSPGGHEPNWKLPRIGMTSYKKLDRLFRSCSLPCKQAKHRYTSLCLVHVCTVRSNVQFVCFAVGFRLVWFAISFAAANAVSGAFCKYRD